MKYTISTYTLSQGQNYFIRIYKDDDQSNKSFIVSKKIYDKIRELKLKNIEASSFINTLYHVYQQTENNNNKL